MSENDANNDFPVAMEDLQALHTQLESAGARWRAELPLASSPEATIHAAIAPFLQEAAPQPPRALRRVRSRWLRLAPPLANGSRQRRSITALIMAALLPLLLLFVLLHRPTPATTTPAVAQTTPTAPVSPLHNAWFTWVADKTSGSNDPTDAFARGMQWVPCHNQPQTPQIRAWILVNDHFGLVLVQLQCEPAKNGVLALITVSKDAEGLWQPTIQLAKAEPIVPPAIKGNVPPWLALPAEVYWDLARPSNPTDTPPMGAWGWVSRSHFYFSGTVGDTLLPGDQALPKDNDAHEWITADQHACVVIQPLPTGGSFFFVDDNAVTPQMTLLLANEAQKNLSALLATR